MEKTTVWYSGKNNHKKNTFTKNESSGQHKFNLEFIDQDIPSNRSLDEIFFDHVSSRQTKVIEVLYSGGLDSECVLNSCINNNLHVRAITMRLLVSGFPINTHDLYYSERFCRRKQVQQVFVDLNLDSFLENGEHFELLAPYNITLFHVALHFWLFKQCTGFPILGGDYSWPHLHYSPIYKPRVISPHRHAFAIYDKFMSDNSIDGIGNMLSYSAESNLFFLKKHVELVENDANNIYGGDDFKISFLKRDLLKSIGFDDVEHRMKSYGLDIINPSVFEVSRYNKLLRNTFGDTESSVTWGTQIADIIHGVPGTNYLYK